MSNLERGPHESLGGGRAAVAVEPVRELLVGRTVPLGGPRAMQVTRTLPNRDRRMVGAWCFLDFYGPHDLRTEPAMRVPPHPHTGLQTVSWLVAGEVLHRDSLGSEQLVRPGELNLMTAGRGIAHSEETPAVHSPVLHGVQLWIALPHGDRNGEPHFEHHPDLPVLRADGVAATVMIGELAGVRSPAKAYSPLVGAELSVEPGADASIPLDPGFEYALLVLSGAAVVDGLPISVGPLLYLGCGRPVLSLRADQPSRLLLIGGEPFDEEIVMWWNFVARDHDEIVAAREEWMSGRGFGAVHGYQGDALAAPPMPNTRLKPRGRLRE